jgi:hypothetical protein
VGKTFEVIGKPPARRAGINEGVTSLTGFTGLIGLRIVTAEHAKNAEKR